MQRAVELMRCLALGAALVLVAGAAQAVSIGGTDAQSQYTASSGIFTFDDTVSGTAERGTVTTADNPALAALVSGRIDLEIKLDTSGFNPATDLITGASFIGTGPAAEILIWDSTETIVLLSFDVTFVNVTNALPSEIAPPGGTIIVGNPVASSYGTDSALTVAGGTMAAAAGGIGTQAVLHINISDPVPTFDLADLFNYLDSDFTVGLDVGPTSEVVWEIELLVPEPGTVLLLGMGIAVLASRRRSA
ncbi:MAG: PEP-CTERM sorting domain-containing protein [bacterium]|nr:PEP-CTERM sorting domain-containing protein [bacterium]